MPTVARTHAARRFRDDRGGSTAIEYALIAALIGTAIIGGLSGTTNSVGGSFQIVLDKVGAIVGK